MTDPFDKMKRALDAVTPEPSSQAAHMAEAEKIFARLQGTEAEARPTSDRPEKRGAFRGVFAMVSQLKSRTALVGGGSLVAASLALFLVLPEMRLPEIGPRAEMEHYEPVMEPAILQEETAEAADDLALFAPPAPAAKAGDGIQPLASPAPMVARERVLSLSSEADWQSAPVIAPDDSEEAFASAEPNRFTVTAESPVSTFSIDTDTASYSIVRSSILNGQLPPEAAVRIEEMVNYFPYAYPAPEGDAPFRADVAVFETPWNADTQMVRIGLQGAMPPVEDRPPLNLVFLVDTSGSMQDSDKLPLLIQSFRLMLPNLTAADEVAIVTYAGTAGVALTPTPATERAAISAALAQLTAGGSTAGEAGLTEAYALARQMAAEGEVSRVILATDGDFNVGLSDPSALEDYIAGQRDDGVYLSVLGFGRGNLDDATMQALAQNGNGQAAYIDTLSEARKVLVDQLTGALFPIADDVKIQVEFNPATVAEYRLIGYETRALAREDFNNDKVDAGEIGAGHSVTALYEVTPVGSPAVLNEPLRYAAEAPEGAAEELGFLRLRYKAPGEAESQLMETPIPVGTGPAPEDARFAAAIAGFAQLLTGGRYLGDWGFAEAIGLAEGARGADAFGYRAEAVNLMRLAEALSR